MNRFVIKYFLGTIHSFIHSFSLPLGFTQCFSIDKVNKVNNGKEVQRKNRRLIANELPQNKTD